jgi:hypothetical protein
VVTSVAGDLPVDRVREMLPESGELRVVSRNLLWRLVRDADFRHLFQQDAYYYSGPSMGPNGTEQLALFEL